MGGGWKGEVALGNNHYEQQPPSFTEFYLSRIPSKRGKTLKIFLGDRLALISVSWREVEGRDLKAGKAAMPTHHLY